MGVMVMHDPVDLLAYLQRLRLIPDGPAEVRRLSGGVSSDLHAVIPANGCGVVVKRALDTLLVQDDWHADPARNRFEVAWFRHVAGIPGMSAHLPRILHDDADEGLFVMEFLAGDWLTWKARLQAGELDVGTAALAGSVLGAIHAATYRQPDCVAAFPTAPSFAALRLDPYLHTTAERVPVLAGPILAEIARLAESRLALVHGDFSPKNLLVRPGRLIVLDAEVATCSDPAFDLAFLLNHLLLKAVRYGPWDDYMRLISAVIAAYFAAFPQRPADLENHAVRLQMMLMLARLWGKSPVEYLHRDDACGQALTTLLITSIPSPPHTFADWCDRLRRSRMPTP
jgi:tRNA A-37 threonylcarbamoyl transferase component Bud32